jgi:hypothetical protein
LATQEKREDITEEEGLKNFLTKPDGGIELITLGFIAHPGEGRSLNYLWEDRSHEAAVAAYESVDEPQWSVS